MYRPYMSSLADSRPFQDVESQLRGLTQDFCMAFNTGNYDQAAALFAGDGVLMAPLNEAAYGQKLVERLLRQLGESGYSDLRFETTRVDYSGDMAMELGRFTMVVRQANGTKIAERGKYVIVWKRLGAWLIMAECLSLNPPAASDRAA
jgi:ketosteroid isomerase-like protein